MNRHGEDLRRVRGAQLMGAAALLFVVLAARLFTMQILQADHYRALSDNNRAKLVRQRAPRGLMVDRNHLPVAGNRVAFSLLMARIDAARHPRTVQAVSALSGRDTDALWRSLDRGRANRYEPVVLLRDVSFETLSRLEEKSFLRPGTSIEVEPVRDYPWGPVAAHLVGYMGEVAEADLKTLNARGYRLGDSMGKIGLERALEFDLRGRDGGRFVEVDAVGREVRPLEGKRPVPPVEGHRLVLPLDMRLCELAARALAETSTGTGAVVALDPRNGDILALVSSPSFDPNAFSGGVSTDLWRSLNGNPSRPLLNRAIAGRYPPGSVFKVAMAAMALEDGAVTTETRFAPCHGSYRFGSRSWGCWKKEGHGSLTLLDAIAKSCDVYFYQLGRRLGLERMTHYADAWGIFGPTASGLPGEQRGHFPDHAWLDQRYGENGWTRAVELNLAIGQGEVLMTPLEIAAMVAGIANGGQIPEPRSWVRVETADGEVVRTNDPRSRSMGLRPETLALVREGMRRVVTGGTATRAALPGIAVAGKTGTAQNPHGDDHAWFVGFAPADAPEIVVLALVEQGGHGSSAAAPVVRRVMAAWFGLREDPPA